MARKPSPAKKSSKPGANVPSEGARHSPPPRTLEGAVPSNFPREGDSRPAGPASNGFESALERLKALYGFMTERQLQSVEIDEGDLRVRLVRRSTTQAPVAVPMSSAAPAPRPPITASQPHAPAPMPASYSAGGEDIPAGASPIKAPMMGIFYRAASPSSPPFVKEGDTVKTGQVLCMIEAMKVFNEIKAEYAGVVAKVLVENGKPVKSGQPLLAIQRA